MGDFRRQRCTLQPEFERSDVFYDRVAGEYDQHMSRKSSDALTRAAFVELVTRHVESGSTLLDFGCGTGLDAAEYLQRGYRVHAYDNSTGMMARLQARCEPHIASGALSTYTGDYSAFLDRLPLTPSPQAVVSNFAVLNLIRDVDALFSAFARHLAPPGWLILSILNPVHWSRLRSAYWWRCFIHRSERAPVNGTQPYLSYLHFIPALLRVAPQFHLVGRANAGSSVRYDGVLSGENRRFWWNADEKAYRRLLWQTGAHRLLGHFVFLVLRRDR